MKEFKNTKVAQLIRERWGGNDMEVYFEERSKAFLDELKENAINK